MNQRYKLQPSPTYLSKAPDVFGLDPSDSLEEHSTDPEGGMVGWCDPRQLEAAGSHLVQLTEDGHQDHESNGHHNDLPRCHRKTEAFGEGSSPIGSLTGQLNWISVNLSGA